MILCCSDLKSWQPRGNVYLHLDDETVQADYRAGLGGGKQGCGSFEIGVRLPVPMARQMSLGGQPVLLERVLWNEF